MKTRSKKAAEAADRLEGRMAEVKIVVAGASLGGFGALETVLSGLQREFPLPVAVVAHREKDPDRNLSALLQERCRLTVVETKDREAIAPGRVYLAPPDHHLLVEEGRFFLSKRAPVHHARPSVDVLFMTAAKSYGEDVIGVILAGAGEGGVHGAARIREEGGIVLVQDPATAESSAMAEAVIAAGAADRVLPLRKIAPALAGLSSFARTRTDARKG